MNIMLQLIIWWHYFVTSLLMFTSVHLQDVIECPKGKYGVRCRQSCFCDWKGARFCHHRTGKCVCTKGYRGELCDEEINECHTNGSQICPEKLTFCENTKGSFKCRCRIGYQKRISTGQCKCCAQGYGTDCKQSCDCLWENTLSCELSTGECLCKPGWEGPRCSRSVDDCLGTPCNEMTCVDLHNSYACICDDNKRYVQGACKECIIDFITHQQQPSCGDWVTLYFLFRLDSDYQNNPRSQPNFVYSIVYNDNPICSVDFHQHAQRVTGNEDFIQKLEPTVEYSFYIEFSIFITGARVNTIKATPASPEYTDKMLLLDSTMTDVSLLFCLKNAHIMNGSNGLGVHTFYMADFAEFELNFTASSTCQSVKVEWNYYKILLSTETESLQLKCIVQKSLIPLSIHTILEKVGLIAISNQDEKKEIVPVSALPMGLYALCATAYVNNDKKLKVSDCTFFKVVPKIKVQIRLTLPVIYIEWPLNQKIAIGGNVTLLTSEKEIQRPRINYILERLSTYGKCSYSTGKDRWTVNYYLQSYLPLMVSSPVKCRMNSTVYVSHTNFKSTFVQEINFVSETTLAVTLKCWQSCDQIVGLKENVVYQVQPIYNDQERKERVLATFLWTMHTNDRQVDTDSILYGDKHSDLMTTKTSTLESNSTYLIQCEYRVELGETVRDGKLKFVVKTQNAPTGEGCTITPTAGLPVKTEFTIQCTGFNESNHCQYRVYQHLFHTNGHGLHVLIGYGNMPEISKLTLSPVKKDNSLQNTSTLIVEVINDLKSSTFYSLMVNFKPWNQNNISDEISDTINKLQIINQEDLRLALNMASLLHLETISSLTEMRTRLQYLFRHFTVKHVDALEMVSWTTLLLAESEIDPEEIELRYSILTLEKIARNLSQTSFINIETTDKLARIQMFATQALLAKLFTWCTNKTDNETDTVRQIEKCLYWGQRLINSVTFIVQVLRNILFLKQEPIQLSTEQLEIQLETHYLNSDTLFNLKTSDGRTNVVLPGKALREDLLRISLDFQVYKKNPYFGLSDNIQQDMPLVQINFFEATLHTVVKSHRLSEPADIFIEFDKSTQNGTHYDVSMQLFEHDSEFRIVRSACIYMSIPASSKEATVLSIVSLAKLQLVIKARYTDIISDFKNMYDEEMLTFPLKTVEVMDTPSGTLNRDNNLIVLPLLQRFQINKNIKFYSILIRLKLHQKVDGLGDTQESLQNTTIVITPYKVSCLHFDRHAQKFLSDKCMLSMFSSLHLLHCQCVVTAFYTGRFIVAPKLINLLDVKLLKFTNNPLVVSMLIALWMIALAAVVHGRRKDKEDQFKTDVTILEDNKEDHSYVYLLCVVTGWFARAYTTSNVFIVMKGSWDNSDTHILCNQKRNLFQSGSEDWFLLTTKGDLGKIHSIEVWTDFSGAHPSWYLKSIYVQNMLTGETWVCKYNSWFSCDFDNTNLKADIPAIEEHEYMRCTFLQLASRTQLSLRNEHLWFGMIAKSPSNVFTRVRRIVTGLTVLQTLMLINLIYFGIEHFDDSQQVLKVLGYNIHVTSIKIGFQSSLFGCIVAFCVAIMFNSIAPQPSLHQSAEDEQELVQTRLQRSRFISTHQVKISSKRKSESSESLSHSEIRVIKRSIFQTEGMDPAHKPTNKSYSSKDEHGNENKDWRSNSLVEPEGDHEIRQVKTSFRSSPSSPSIRSTRESHDEALATGAIASHDVISSTGQQVVITFFF
ncbi:uncharacterized protein LOC106079668 isoform X4 [Biomphalaria glabrata]|uniref:Uncharacterized protein LOC106079668 isoform X4 n=1 Tax=Biomphalaria glabrata TaxID=6526 RepID=A0A9W2ZE01_BIOGL|nr:uncharacterized protein LOC106079668 isoform X4 [Biomphalaria glabrata]